MSQVITKLQNDTSQMVDLPGNRSCPVPATLFMSCITCAIFLWLNQTIALQQRYVIQSNSIFTTKSSDNFE